VNKGEINPGSTRQSRIIEFTGYEYFKFYQRKWRKGHAGNHSYKLLWNALERLHHTHITTDLKSKGVGRLSKFYWLPFIEKTYDERTKKNTGYQVEFPGWLYEQIMDRADDGKLSNIVSLDYGYFEMLGGLERWLYLWCHKSYNPTLGQWTESFRSLHGKSGTTNTFSQFSRYLRNIIRRDSLLGYKLNETISRSGPSLCVVRRSGVDLLLTPKQLRDQTDVVIDD
jgi:plasmid replication initiation protein